MIVLPAAGAGANRPSEYRDFRYASGDGLALYARDYGDASSPWLPVVCLAGLSRTARDFHALALHLSRQRERPRRVVAFDYRGRGQSAWDPKPVNYNVAIETTDILDGMAALGIPRAAVVGTSRGGIIGMVMAFARPRTVAALVLNDIGPFVEPRGLARLRTYVGRTPPPADWKDAARIQRRLHAAQFPAFDDGDWEEFARLTYADRAGAPVSDYDARLAETLANVDVERPAPGIWNEFRAIAHVPVLAIRGANSDILSEATQAQMRREHPRVETVVVPDQGHPPQLRPGPLLAEIAAFIAAAEDAPVTMPTRDEAPTEAAAYDSSTDSSPGSGDSRP